jgi:hypothetical protein
MEEKKGYGCLTLITVIFIFYLVSLFYKAPTTQKAKSFPEPTKTSQTTQVAPELLLSPTENLSAAKKCLADKNKTTPFGNIFQASQHLTKIKEGDKEYPEAQKILKYIAECYKKLDRPIDQKRKGGNKSGDVLANLSSAEDAGLRLFALQSRGFIRMYISEPSTFIEVEPKAWASMLHQDKEKICQLAKSFITGLNQQQGKRIDFVIFRDMTQKETLADICLKDGYISIKK